MGLQYGFRVNRRPTYSVDRPSESLSPACPHSVANYKDIANQASDDLKMQVVPSTEPTAGLICRYQSPVPGFTPPLKFTPKTTLGPNRARKLALDLRVLKVGFDGGGFGQTECLNFFAQAHVTEIIVLSYPDRPDVDLWLYGIGCGDVVANGFVRAGLTRGLSDEP